VESGGKRGVDGLDQGVDLRIDEDERSIAPMADTVLTWSTGGEGRMAEATIAGNSVSMTNLTTERRPRDLRPVLALGGVLLVFVLLASVIAFRTPAYESADEPGHVENIETLVSGHLYGMSSTCPVDQPTRCSGTEAHQPPLYYLIMAGWQLAVGVPARPPYHGPADIAYAAEHGFFIHHSAAAHRFLLWLRLPDVILGALAVFLTFRAALLVTDDPWTPVVAASVVAFLPRFVFLSSFVTNDNLVNVLGAALLLTTLRFMLKPTRWRMTVVGLVVGLLVITKLSALPLVLLLPLIAYLQQGRRRRVELTVVGGATGLLVSGWYLIQNTVRYGSPLASEASKRYLAKIGGLGTFPGHPYHVHNPLSLVLVHVPSLIFQRFWYESGWNVYRWPWPVSLVFWAVLAAGLVGLAHRPLATRIFVPLIAIALLGFGSVWVVAFQTATYNPRLALVGLPALAVLVAKGVERWRLPGRFLLPAMELVGTLVAIQQNVLAVHWS
jgi:hypothetical protein